MRILVAGSSGLIGSALVERLARDGHQVVRLVRRPAANAGEVQWDPSAGALDPSALGNVDGVVNLAGEGIGDKRWTPGQKEKILASRVGATSLLTRTLARLPTPPSVLVNGSAIGYYGNRGDEVLTESSGPGTGFLADVVRQWEQAAQPAIDAGIRTVFVRTGIVLSSKGGALGQLLPLARLGLGGKLGSGKQWWSWVTIDDEVGLIVHALTNDSVRGPMNATSPNPATNAEITKMIGTILSRPAFLIVPKFALSIVKGNGLTEEMIFADQRVVPRVAQETGYRFEYADLGAAIRKVLARP